LQVLKTRIWQILKAEVQNMSYVCKVCGYIYDEEQGDTESGAVAGTTFEQLPDGWTCPLCGVGKEEFVKEE
jgi:rubredoxin